MALVTVTMFTSCDKLWRDSEDREEAYTLEGTWTGYIDTYIYDRYGLSGDSYREVYGGEIRIRYADSWNDVYIYDYGLNDYSFWGYMDDGTSRDIHFSLNYDSRFDWGYWTRSFTRSADHKNVKASGKFAEAIKNKE